MRGKHAAPRNRRGRLTVAATLSVLAGLVGPVALTQPASASTESLGNRVLDKAETRVGDWYQWAAAGPSTFDCSGLVVWAAAQLGIYVPHSTYSMLAGTGHLYRIPLSQARRGDLVFYGSGHVELLTRWYHTSFGAQQTGTRVGWHEWSGYWQPTMAMRFR